MKGLRALYLGTAAASAMLSVSANAADLPSRAVTPAVPVVAAPTWTGFYIGASAGADITTNNYNSTGFDPNLVALIPGNYDANTNASFGQTNPRLGLYLGYNYQVSSYVFGIEGDAAYDFGRTKSTTGIPGTVNAVVAGQGGDADSVRASSRYDASVRLRAGYLITPAILAYATGGVAFRDATYTLSGPGNNGGAPSYFSLAEYANHQKVQTGWTVGGGIEGFFAPNWLARVEYRYSDFGGKNYSDFVNTPGLSGADSVFSHTHLTSSTVLVGVAYKFSASDVAPVVARY